MDIYWHIQMNQPWGRAGEKIDSSQLLKENPPIIGTGDWDNYQCDNFRGGDKGLKEGDIILVREGSIPLALCRVISDCYEDDNLSQKYGQEFFRKVEILNWYEGDFRFPQAQKTLERLLNKKTESYQFIDKYYKQTLKILEMKKIQEYIDLLHYKPQIILQGPPGTGKTQKAKRIARALLGLDENGNLEDCEQFKLIQFHPSYSYEDFVRGIVAKNTDGNISYVTENKVLAEFAKKALEAPFEPIKWEDFRDYLKEEKEKKENVFFDKKETIKLDFIKKFEDGDAIYVQCFDKGTWKSGNNGINLPKNFTQENLEDNFKEFYKKYDERDWKYITDYFIDWAKKYKKKPYVLIIDEINRANLSAVLGELIYAFEYRGEAVQSMYAIDDDNTLILPANLYIIGTMNTADRSVGHIDYAIRRRFAFVDILPKDLTNKLGDNFATKLYEEVSKLFEGNTLSPEFRKEEVQLGHSYFITEHTPINIRWEYEIKPILLEYIKDGVLINVEEKIQNIEKIVYENSLA